MNTVYLILGCNIGDKFKNLERVVEVISEKAGIIIKKSNIYETAAWGNVNQPDFLNQALCIETPFSATDLLKILLSIEQSLGRTRNEQKWMERTMDIDILFYNNAIIDSIDLKVPHPYLHLRKFVLVPMAEIAANFVHPVLKKNITTLLEDSSDDLRITKFQKNGQQTDII